MEPAPPRWYFVAMLPILFLVSEGIVFGGWRAGTAPSWAFLLPVLVVGWLAFAAWR